jgi:16S rRNA (uracil1498-N3)-methyltransferase
MRGGRARRGVLDPGLTRCPLRNSNPSPSPEGGTFPTVNLLLLSASDVGADGRVRLADARAAHVLQVLRATPGQSVRVGVIDGPFGVGIVHTIADGAVELTCSFEAETPSRPAVDLLLAVPRPKVLRRLWAQLAALGVGQIILTNAERVERNYFDTHVLTPECFEPLLIEGLQQARDTRLPRVSVHRRFKVLVEDDLDGLSSPSGCVRMIADPAAARAVTEVCRGRDAARALLAVGPEGGWNTFEQDLLEAHGFQPTGLGPRTLRTDTACVALLALVHEAMRAAVRD